MVRGFVEAPADRGRVADVLAAGDGDEGTLRQVGLGLAVVAGAHEVAGVDGGGGELAGLACVGAAPGPPDAAGLGPVVVGHRVAHQLEGVAAGVEVLGAVGDEFELAGLDFGAVLLVLEVAEVGHEAISSAVESLCLSVEHVDEAPEEAFAFVGELGSDCADAVCEDLEGSVDGVDGVGFVPDVPGVGFVGLGGSGEELSVLADSRHDGLSLVCDVVDIHDDLLMELGTSRSVPGAVPRK